MNRHPFPRRRFLKSGLVATSAGLLAPALPVAASTHPPKQLRSPLIDTNITLGDWPLRRLPTADPDRLISKLREHHVTQAWAGTFDGLLHKDLASANARLTDICRRHGDGVLLPFGSINPRHPDWEEELRRCVEIHRMPGIRLHPNYHGYPLDDPSLTRLLGLAAGHRLIVQLTLAMEDERMMHPLLRVGPVDTQPLAEQVRKVPGLSLVLLNALRTLRAKPLLDLIATGKVFVDIAMLEGVGGLETLLQQVPAQHILFGSHAPLFYFEAALLKLQESPLSEPQLQAIRSTNARQLLAPLP